MSKRKNHRTIQRITGIHRIHHIWYSYGYKLPLINLAYFKKYGLKRIDKEKYHDCTVTGVY